MTQLLTRARRSVQEIRQTARVARRAAGIAIAVNPRIVTAYVVVTLATGVVPIAIAWLTKLIIDSLSLPEWSGPGLHMLVLTLALVTICAGALPYVGRYLNSELGRMLRLSTQSELYAAVNSWRGLARFEDPAQLDRIQLARQASEIAPAQILQSVLGIIRSFVSAFGYVAALAVLSLPIAALVVGAALPGLVAQIYLARRRAQMVTTTTPMLRRQMFFANLLRMVPAAMEIRLFGIGDFLRERILTDQRRANSEQRRQDLRESSVQGLLVVLAAVVSGIALFWAATAARQGQLTVGDVALTLAAVAGVQGALGAAVEHIGSVKEAQLLFDEYLAIVDDTTERPKSSEEVYTPQPLAESIVIDDVWFRYSERHPWVLKGVSLTIAAGTACALVGLNGSGKSTLIKLLCRFYEPERGAIRWDGVDLRDIPVEQLRRSLGVLFQDFMHYDLSAEENIALGELAAREDPERIQAAARLAGVHETLAGLPRGYRTPLSRTFMFEGDKNDAANGVVLSGGQWQRVALARALLGRHDVLVLDEPSAGLDAAAEHEIHSRLRVHRAGKTSLLISHRLGAVRDADLIAVLSGGVVVEQGTHAELLAINGEYARLFRLQAQGYRPDGELLEDSNDAGRDPGPCLGDSVGALVGASPPGTRYGDGKEHGALPA